MWGGTRFGWALVILLLWPAAAGCSGAAPPSVAPTAGPAAAAAAATPVPTPGAMRFRVAATQPAAVAAHLLPYWVGIDTGLFREQGLGVELVTMQSDQMALTAAANGEVDVVLSTPSPTLLAIIASGMDGVIIGATHNAFDQRLLAASDIQSPDDLRGKSALISAQGTLNDFQTREALQRIGIDPDKELAGWWMGANQAERVKNLRLGNGQTTVVPLPLSATLVAEGFTDFGDLSAGPPWPGVAMIMSRRIYSARLDYVQRFLKGLLASIQRTKADPDTAKQILAQYTKIEDPDALDEAYDVYGNRLLERVPYLSVDGLQRAVDFAAETRFHTRPIKTSDLVDQTALQRLESSGYVDQLYR
ncbi:MAG TPA: ABC transporter substrate-binding protein [Chloroflexota bacterium]|nr:ABC transporter substrate-binding protein [Chloroflexota bacterium]